MHSVFFDFRAGGEVEELIGSLRPFEPDVIVAFRPETLPIEALDDLDAVTVGFLTEPLPRAGNARHSDLERRLADLRAVDPQGFDRIVCFDPLLHDAAAKAGLALWRAVALPVHDRYFATVRRSPRPPRCVFVGRSTDHRERFLTPLKHAHDLLHIAHGLDADALAELLVQVDVAVNLHNEPYPSFENRVCLHLAAGHLVISEPLSPSHGLEAGLDYLEVTTPAALSALVARLYRNPDLFLRVRLYGRSKAELFRASRVYPRLMTDLFRDLETFGTTRRRATSSRRLRALAAFAAGVATENHGRSPATAADPGV